MGVFHPTQDVIAKPVENYVWDPGTLSWVKETQPGAGPGGGLTDAELRASPVPVSVTGGGDATAANQVTGNASLASIDSKLTNPLPVSGTVTTGGLTDTQLRAAAVPVSGTVAIGAGSAVIGHVITDTGSTTAVTGNVAVTNAGLTNLDVALSTRTKPADQQHAIIDSGTTVVTQPTGTNLHTVVDSGSITAVQGTGTNLHTVVDSGSITAVAQPGVDIGDVTVNNAAGAAAVNIQDGGNSITVDGSITAIATSTSRSDSYTSTTNGIAITATSNPFKAYAIQAVGQGTAASLWDIRLEGSLDGSNFDQILQHTNTTGDSKVVYSGSLVAPSLYFRSRCAGLTLGTATSVLVTIVGIQ